MYGVGGLSGVNAGSITNCFADVRVRGSQQVGGLVGVNGSIINNCYTTGSVSGDGMVGGVVGDNYGSLTNCYATGAVSATMGGGGVIGGDGGDFETGKLSYCAALNPSISGLYCRRVGYCSTLTNNIAWSGMVPLSGATFGTGAGNNSEGADKNKTEVKSQATYTALGWSFGSSEASPWKMGVSTYELPVFYWQTAAPAAMPAHLAGN